MRNFILAHDRILRLHYHLNVHLMEIQFDIHGSSDNLYAYLRSIIGTGGFNLQQHQTLPFIGTVEPGMFSAKPIESSASIKPRIRGEIISLANRHTVKVRLGHLLKYRLMIIPVLIAPVSALALFIFMAMEDMSSGHEFPFYMLKMTLLTTLIAGLPFLWMYVIAVHNAKSEVRRFCEDLIRAARP